jgi:protein-S-isoprenylcysteine O-methyltransferase Ste14
LTIYVLASVALGTKASNLTNRGIIKAFPYNIVRHPAYISKNVFWLCSVLVLIIMAYENSTSSFMVFISQAFFILVAWAAVAAIYYFRALTEEQHLMRDPDYREYVNEVKYRFIPHII